jgi:pimeloyl-ACP methyl ester carboxylesterase
MGDRLHCIEAGHSSQPTVVLLHGFGAVASCWREVITAIEGSTRVLAFDLPGHGGSLDYPNAGSGKVAAQAVIAELDYRSLGKVHLVGHSMGGAIACSVALARPDLVASLTLLSPGGFGPELNVPLLQDYAAAATPSELLAALAPMAGAGAFISLQTIRNLVAMRGGEGQREMLEFIVGRMARDGKQGVLPLTDLAGLHIPTTLLWGKADRIVPVSQCHAAPMEFNKVILPKAGHMLIEEAPEAVAALILKSSHI